MRTVFIMISFLLLMACNSSDCQNQQDLNTIEVTIDVERLEESIFGVSSKEELSVFLQQNKTFASLFLDAEQYPHDSILVESMYGLINNPSIDTLYNEAVAAFADISAMKETLETAVGKLKSIYPEVKVPKLHTAVTGLYRDLYISDTLIIVGIDFFIGPTATFRPLEIPQYMLQRYSAAHVPSIIVKTLAGNQVANGKDATLLSEMIDFGKTYYLASRIAPCIPDSLLLGYTSQDMEVIYENEPVIWANFIHNEVLYETNHIVKRKFLGERPNVHEISAKCPGRIGAWIGWNIVEQYMQNNDVSIQQLIEETDNHKIFKLSGYKPQSH